jgi:septation ring formation regulator EzrA
MNETHFAEIEKTLLFVSDARKRAEKAAKELRRDGAEAHLVAALEAAERELEQLGRRLMQQTYFAVPQDQLELASAEPEPVEELTLS